MHTPGNKETRMNLRDRPAPGNWCGNRLLNTCTESTKWRQMCWYGECSCLRQWKQPFILDNLKVYKNTNFEEFRICSKSHRNWYWNILKKILNENKIESTSPAWTRSTSSLDQVIKWTEEKSTCLLRFCSMPGEDVWALRRNWKMARSSGRIQNVTLLQRIAGNRCRSNWIRVEICSQDLRHCRFFK